VADLKILTGALDALDNGHDTVYNQAAGPIKIGLFIEQSYTHSCASQESIMGTYGLRSVIQMWELEQLTTEQAVGQILQLMADIEKRVGDLERRYSRMNRLKSSSASVSGSRQNGVESDEIA